MKFKELTVTGASLVSLIGLIIFSVHPKSNIAQIKPRSESTSANFKIVRVTHKTISTVETEQQQKQALPENLNLETVAKK